MDSTSDLLNEIFDRCHLIKQNKRTKKQKHESDTHCPDVTGFGAEGGEGAEEVTTEVATAFVAGVASDGGATSEEGISTCFQSCPSSTMRAMRVPRRTLRLPSSICSERSVLIKLVQ